VMAIRAARSKGVTSRRLTDLSLRSWLKVRSPRLQSGETRASIVPSPLQRATETPSFTALLSPAQSGYQLGDDRFPPAQSRGLRILRGFAGHNPSYSQPNLAKMISLHRSMRLRGLGQWEDAIDDRADPAGAKVVAETAHE